MTLHPRKGRVDDLLLYAKRSTSHGVESTLERVSDWGNRNLVTFNPTKTQVCAFSSKKVSFTMAPSFQDIPLSISGSIGILGVEISNEVQYGNHLEAKAVLTSKKLGVLNRAKQYFTPKQRLLLYKAQVRPHVEYCSHLWHGAPKYQLLRFDSLQRRTIRIIGDPKLTDSLRPLSQRRDIGSLCVFYRLYNGQCSDELFNLIPASRFYHRFSRHRDRAHPHILDPWVSRTTRFSRSFLPYTQKLWNELPPEVFPLNFDMNSFKKKIKKVLQGRQRNDNAPGVVGVYRRR